MQSRNICVKCQPDGELSVGRKVMERLLAVYILHPAATHNGKYLL